MSKDPKLMAEMQSLGRGLKILDLIADAERSMTITELANALEIDKSSASRLAQTLVKYGFLQPDTVGRGYMLGKRIRQMSWQYLNRLPVREKAKPYLYRLVEQTGECSHTAVLSDGKALMIDDVEADASLRVVGGIGRMIPLHCTAVGKGLLAFSDYPIPTELEPKTSRTITDVASLQAQLALTQTQGYAYDDEEHQEGVRCIAAPVYDVSGLAIAAIGISGPTVRVTPERVQPLAEMVMQAARDLSTDLGYAIRVNGQKRKKQG